MRKLILQICFYNSSQTVWCQEREYSIWNWSIGSFDSQSIQGKSWEELFQTLSWRCSCAPTRTVWQEKGIVTGIVLSVCLFRVRDNALTPITSKILLNSFFRWKKKKHALTAFEDRPRTGRRCGVFGLGYVTSGCQKANEWNCSHLVHLVKWFSFLIHDSWPLRMMKRKKKEGPGGWLKMAKHHVKHFT